AEQDLRRDVHAERDAADQLFPQLRRDLVELRPEGDQVRLVDVLTGSGRDDRDHRLGGLGVLDGDLGDLGDQVGEPLRVAALDAVGGAARADVPTGGCGELRLRGEHEDPGAGEAGVDLGGDALGELV